MPVRIAVVAAGDGKEPLEILLRQQETQGLHVVDDSDDADVVHLVGWSPSRGRVVHHRPTVLSPPRLEGVLSAERQRQLLEADAVVVHTSQQRDVAHALGVPWYRLFVVPETVDVEVFRRKGDAARRTERCRIVLEATGPGDGVASALAALATWEVAEAVVLSSSRLPTLRRDARKLGLGRRFVAVTPKDDEERAWWIRSAHAVVAVPEKPTSSRLALEAMGCGVPVVATSVDLLEDVVVHGVTGLHVPPGDPKSLVHAVRSIVTDPFRLEAFGMAASDRAGTRYAPLRVGRDLLAVYRRVLAGRPGQEPDVIADDAAELPDAVAG
ncbi:MAG TPA: glycosyltransferase [Candidatus Nanopelagicales bacterium]|nr:glycosyltransferase [Candidatus Nanopelagicales bacterium]